MSIRTTTKLAIIIFLELLFMFSPFLLINYNTVFETSVTIPESVTSISSGAFANNPLTSARVPTSTVIQSNAFPAPTVITRY